METQKLAPIGGRLGISGTLEWRDKDGNIIKTTELKGSLPLDTLQPAEKEAEDGPDDRE